MNSDAQFYDSRATDALAARADGDMDALADVVAQVLIEEGPSGLGALTDAVNRAQA